MHNILIKKNQFKNLVFPSQKLSLSLIELNDWSLIRVYGSDSKTYLQSQLTINVDLLKSNQHIFCAHCDINGKVWSTLRLFYFNNGYAYIIRNDVMETQIRELKRYAIFSKVTISQENNFLLLGIAGSKARETLRMFFVDLPDKNNMLIIEKNITLLWIQNPEERFLLILPKVHKVILDIKKNIIIVNSNQWLSLDIESSFPIISKNMMNKFIPLSLNLEMLGGIDFKKGCYCGQEVIAKMKFRLANKYSLYWLMSMSNFNLPDIGSLIEYKKNEYWYTVGYVLFSVIMYDGTVWIQAILNNKQLTIKSTLRIRNQKNSFLYINH